MWWARAERVQAYIGRSVFGWKDDATGEGWQACADAAEAVALLAQAGARLREYPRQRAFTVWTSASMARPFVLPGDCGARSREEALALAAGRSAEFAGVDGDVSVWLSPWKKDRDCVAVVMEAPLLRLLQSTCAEVGLPLAGVRPWWNPVLDRITALADRSGGRVAGWSLSEPDGLVSGSFAAALPSALHVEQRGSVDPDWAGWLKRQAVLASPERLHVHCTARLGDASKSGAPCEAAIGRWDQSVLGAG